MQRLTLATAICLAAPTAQLALAQQDDIETITVLGTKSEQSLMDSPESISVITEEEIAREPIIDLYDVIERIPNVTSAFGEQGFAIRGIDQRGIGGGGNGNTLTVYVDDAPLGNQTTFFGPTDSWDVGQIEVYRGPQSTNFGRNALAGAIYIRTQDPSYESDLKIRAEVAEQNTYQIAAAGGGAIIEDTLAFRLAANYREGDGFLENTFLNEPADDTELSSVRAKFLWEPSDDLSVVTTTTYVENHAGEDLINAGAGGSFSRDVAYDVDGREGTETFLQAVRVNWAISDQWHFESISTYQSTDYVRIEDFDVTTAPIAALDRTGDDKALSQELRFTFSGDALDTTLGLYYVETEDGFDSEYIVPAAIINPAIPPALLVQRADGTRTDVTNYAAFFDGSYDLTDKLSLLFGARYDYEEGDTQSSALTQFITDIPPGFEFLRALEGESSVQTDSNFDAFLPKIGLQYAATDNTNIAFVIQQGYRSGGSEISVLDGTVIDYDPEYLTNFELSSRSQLLGGKLNINTNVFYSDWQDQQVAVPFSEDFPDITRTINAGESTLYGAELEADFQAADDVVVYGSAGYVKTEFDDFGEFSGNEFPFAPEFSFNLGFDQRLNNGLFYGLDVNYRSELFSDNNNTDASEVDAVTLVNARLGFQIAEHYQVTVYARNLLDEEYYTYLNRTGSGSDVSGTARVGDPRFVGLRFDVNF